jgi:hypothetical protein
LWLSGAFDLAAEIARFMLASTPPQLRASARERVFARLTLS